MSDDAPAPPWAKGTMPYLDRIALDLVNSARRGVVTAAYDADGTIASCARASAVIAAARALVQSFADGDHDLARIDELSNALAAADGAV